MITNAKFIFIVTLFISLIIISCKETTVEPELFGSISGEVFESREDSLVVVISGASVTTSPATTSLITDQAGKFMFENIRTGSYTISVSKIGFENKTVTVSVREDQTTEVTILLKKAEPNSGPSKVTNPSPPNEAIDQLRNIELSWDPATSTESTEIKYDVYLYDAQSPMPVMLAADIEDTSIAVTDLIYERTYFWQVDSKIQDTLITQGDVWSFSVREQPDYRFFYASKRDGNYEIYTSDSVDTDIIRLTDRPFRDWWPRLRPNRREVAFSSDSEIDFHIFAMNRDGSDIRRITTIPIAGFYNNGIFSWSPDGGHLIYSHYQQLYRIDENGANLTLIATAPADRHFRECEYNAFGDKIIVLTIGEKPYDNEIYTMDANGSNLTMVVGNLPGTVASPSFSIDGNSFMYTYDAGVERPDGRQLDARIFIQSLVDTTLTDVSENKEAGTNDTNPRFSPDGSHVIFENTTNDGFNPKDVWIVEIDGANREKLFISAETPDWK